MKEVDKQEVGHNKFGVDIVLFATLFHWVCGYFHIKLVGNNELMAFA